MLRHFGARAADFIAVVRRLEMKFKQPGRGKILGKATVTDEQRTQLEHELATKRALVFALRVDVHDETGAHNLIGTVEWFITRRQAHETSPATES